ncbi:MAG: glycine betaine ABC transporter substrate-binding protein [Halanaerobiaceae bacterium]
MLKKMNLILLLAVLAVGFLAGCEGERELTVGGKADTESHLLAQMAIQLLEEDGFTVEREPGVQSTLARRALETEEVDLYYEYTGTAYTVYHEQDDQEIMTDSEAVYEWVKEADAEEEIIWLDRLNYNNTYTVMMREERAEEKDIETISDLVGGAGEEIKFATDSEFYERPDGYSALVEEYDLEFGEVDRMSAGIIYEALREGEIDSGTGYSTDGRIEAFGLVNLEDDRDFFPVYNPAPTVKEEVLEEFPEIEEILAPLAEELSGEDIRRLNGEVDIEHREAEDVAQEWLEEEGLI